MRWFSQQRDPAWALVVDGIAWGAGVGFGLPVLLGLLATVGVRGPGALAFGLFVGLVGLLVGTAVGLAVGTCGAVALATCRRLDRPPGETALTTIAVALLAPVAVAELSRRDPSHSVLVLVVIASGPLVLDVVRLGHRATPARRPGRRSRVCGLRR
ncbi:hypothetical protein [Lapillicoccus jejuensis]|uniref:Uncharacterized protein n=1 Tax=Lapillicoccus jejuensis TaxID=402171 RepID=A0A542DWY6_9MICO|nr:hypothetical protein [Lapillicoccus jejuensis]TQJ07597.1 hypothetical protein FB458_0665 [Lapillicoccus jejuensis]